jgi:hypothetical protein
MYNGEVTVYALFQLCGCFISEIIHGILIKFGVEDLPEKLSGIVNFG